MKVHNLLLSLVLAAGTAQAGSEDGSSSGDQNGQQKQGAGSDSSGPSNGTPSTLAEGLDGRASMSGDESWQDYDAIQRGIELEQKRASYYKAKAERLKQQSEARQAEDGGSPGQAQPQDIRLTRVYGRPQNLVGVFVSDGQYWHRREGQTLAEGLRIERIGSEGAVVQTPSGRSLHLGLTDVADIPQPRQPMQGEMATEVAGPQGMQSN